MKKIEGFENMLDVMQKEKGIPKEMLVSAIEAALLSASRKMFKNGDNLNLNLKIDPDGAVHLFKNKTVADEVNDPELEINLKDATVKNKDAKIGDVIVEEITPDDFGRIAAQTAKQVIIQRLREAEKELSFDEFSKKQGDLITGIVQQKEFNGYLINLGRIETYLPFSEVPPNEIYKQKDRIKLYLVEVKKTAKGPFISISRTHPNLIKKLFELEIPEIADGVLEIKNVVREPGRRAKISLISKDPNVNVVGTCVGHMGARIQNIVKELGNERIDIIEWKEDPKAYISNAISPAKPSKIELNKETLTAKVVVPENQLSLAIGKEGQNVRLTAKLTGWKIDIISESQDRAGGEEKDGTKKEAKDKQDKG